MSDQHPLWTIIHRLEMDVREMSAKLQELRMVAAGLELPDPSRLRCSVCRATFRSVIAVQEHTYHSHAGALPDHYVAAERAAGFDPAPPAEAL